MNDKIASDSIFTLYQASHWFALFILLLLCIIIIVAGRRFMANHPQKSSPNRLTKLLAYSCVAGIVLSLVASFIDYPHVSWREFLPFHFCDVMAATCCYALLSNSSNARAIAFFGVLCASAQALITPNLQLDYPALTYYSFFFSHGITVIAVIYLVAVLLWRPRKYDFLVAQIFGILYLLAVHPVNVLLNTNFGFTRYLPENGSVLSFLGPWPWYLVVMQIPAFFFMGFLNYFFSRKQCRHADNDK